MATLYTVGRYEFSDVALKAYGVDEVVKREDYESDDDFAKSLKNELDKRHHGMWSMGLENSGKFHLGIDKLPDYARDAFSKALDEVSIDDDLKTSIGYAIGSASYANMSLKDIENNFFNLAQISSKNKQAGEFLQIVNSYLGDKANLAFSNDTWTEERKTFDNFSSQQNLVIKQNMQKA